LRIVNQGAVDTQHNNIVAGFEADMGIHSFTAQAQSAGLLRERQPEAARWSDSVLPDVYAMWSPHRDSREVMLWKSMLAFRGEPWHWVDEPEQARWFVVDVARGVEPGWTAALSRQRGVKGIALARQWIDLPAPCWTFFKVPLRPDGVLIWIDQEMGRRPQHVHVPGREALPGWQSAELRLTRWPDVTRYGDGAIDLTVVCGLLLRNWTRYEDITHLVQDKALLDHMLADAQHRGHLLVAYGNRHMAAAVTAAAVAPQPPVEDGRWSLLKRIWKRFS
jgi:hypothetical protein